MSMIVLEPGLHSRLVTEKQWQFVPFGVPQGGPADRRSMILGNALLGNLAHAAALEITLSGPVLQATIEHAVVISGAPFEVFINRTQQIPTGHTFTIRAGDTLRIGGVARGCRAYLCVSGGFANPATEDPISAGMSLECQNSTTPGRSYTQDMIGNSYDSICILRTLDGPQRDWFPDDSFWHHRYSVSNSSNRMGVRFNGNPIPRDHRELTSEAITPGAVQVANDGLPIVMGVDGQTIGGYPKIAHVIRADMDQLGQLRPGDLVRFQACTADEARQAYEQREKTIRRMVMRAKISFGGLKNPTLVEKSSPSSS